MNATLLSIEIVESFDGHAIEITIPRFRISIERLSFKPRRWHYFKDYMHQHTDRRVMTPLLSFCAEDWHGRDQEPRVATLRRAP